MCSCAFLFLFLFLLFLILPFTPFKSICFIEGVETMFFFLFFFFSFFLVCFFSVFCFLFLFLSSLGVVLSHRLASCWLSLFLFSSVVFPFFLLFNSLLVCVCVLVQVHETTSARELQQQQQRKRARQLFEHVFGLCLVYLFGMLCSFFVSFLLRCFRQFLSAS